MLLGGLANESQCMRLQVVTQPIHAKLKFSNEDKHGLSHHPRLLRHQQSRRASSAVGWHSPKLGRQENPPRVDHPRGPSPHFTRIDSKLPVAAAKIARTPEAHERTAQSHGGRRRCHHKASLARHLSLGAPPCRLLRHVIGHRSAASFACVQASHHAHRLAHAQG